MPKGIPNVPKPLLTPVMASGSPVKDVKAFTVVRCEGGWQMVTFTIRDHSILKIEKTEPDLLILAKEAFKLAAFRWWNAQ